MTRAPEQAATNIPPTITSVAFKIKMKPNCWKKIGFMVKLRFITSQEHELRLMQEHTHKALLLLSGVKSTPLPRVSIFVFTWTNVTADNANQNSEKVRTAETPPHRRSYQPSAPHISLPQQPKLAGITCTPSSEQRDGTTEPRSILTSTRGSAVGVPMPCRTLLLFFFSLRSAAQSFWTTD